MTISGVEDISLPFAWRQWSVHVCECVCVPVTATAIAFCSEKKALALLPARISNCVCVCVYQCFSCLFSLPLCLLFFGMATTAAADFLPLLMLYLPCLVSCELQIWRDVSLCVCVCICRPVMYCVARHHHHCFDGGCVLLQGHTTNISYDAITIIEYSLSATVSQSFSVPVLSHHCITHSRAASSFLTHT